jgi:hypothetical protein
MFRQRRTAASNPVYAAWAMWLRVDGGASMSFDRTSDMGVAPRDLRRSWPCLPAARPYSRRRDQLQLIALGMLAALIGYVGVAAGVRGEGTLTREILRAHLAAPQLTAAALHELVPEDAASVTPEAPRVVPIQARHKPTQAKRRGASRAATTAARRPMLQASARVSTAAPQTAHADEISAASPLSAAAPVETTLQPTAAAPQTRAATVVRAATAALVSATAIEKLVVRGPLPIAIVRHSVQHIQNHFVRCGALCTAQTPNNGDTWQVALQVDESGHGRAPQIAGPALHPALLACFERAATRLTTPAPDTGRGQVTWEFHFER